MSAAVLAAIAELEAEHARLTTALAALRVLVPGTTMTVSFPPARQAIARANGSKAAAVARRAKSADWHAKADAMLAAGKSVREVAAACGVTEAGIYYHRARGKGKAKPTPKPNGEQPARFRCQECGQHGVAVKACEHCGEKR